MKVFALPPQDRPREKLLAQGAMSLTDSELLALILGSGTKGMNVIELAQSLLNHFGGWRGLARADVTTLRAVKGVGTGKASMLAALGELLIRYSGEEGRPRKVEESLHYLQASIRASEEAYVLAIDGKREVENLRLVARGTSEGLTLEEKEVLRVALSLGSRAFVLAHTHPSGAPFPSDHDLSFTLRLLAAAKEVGLCLLDHVILTRQGSFSFLENRIL